MVIDKKEQVFHYTYQTKNNLNGKSYIGVHSTKRMDDGYLGSGHSLKRAIKKYGKQNFSIEILDFFDSRKEMMDEERFLVDQKWVNCTNNYNLHLGGGTYHAWGSKRPLETRRKISIALTGVKLSEERRLQCIENGKKRKNFIVSEATREKLRIANTGKKLTEEAKQKIIATKKRQFTELTEDQVSTWKAKLKASKVGYKPKIESTMKSIETKSKWTEEEKRFAHRNRACPVFAFSTDTGEQVGEFWCIAEASRVLKISVFAILNALSGKTKNPRTGYNFKRKKSIL